MAGLWQLLAIAQGVVAKLGDTRFDALHRLGFSLGQLGPIHALTLLGAVLLVSLPGYLGDPGARALDPTVGTALGLCGASAVITAIGALLNFRAELHGYSLAGSTPKAALISAAIELVAAAGIALVAFAMALMSLRARR